MYFLEGRTHCIDLCLLLRSSLRKQPTFRNDTPGVPGAKWHLRNVCRNSVLMTRHYPHLGSAFTHVAEPIRSTTQNWVVTRHQYGISALVCQSSFRGKPVIASQNFGCFLRLVEKRRACLRTLVRYCSRQCLLHFWSLFHHPKTLWCLRISWITYLFGWVEIHQINLLLT